MIAKFKKTSRQPSVSAVLVLAVLACITLTDAYPDESPFIFGTLTNLGPVINSNFRERCPNISANGLSLYFSSDRSGGAGWDDLWVTKRTTVQGDWQDPVWLGTIVNSMYNDGSPSISSDGLVLFFESARLGGHGSWDIWATTRATTDGDWHVPFNLGPIVNSTYLDGSPSISADGLSLYFDSERPGFGNSDIWVTTRADTSSPWGTPTNLGSTVNSGNGEIFPRISPNGLMLFFASNRPGGLGSFDNWVTRRETVNSPWGPPVNLGPPINSQYDEGMACISRDGSVMYFNANERPGGYGNDDLWQVDIAVLHKLPDFNRDGNVNFKDFTYLAFSWSDFTPAIDIAPPPYGDGIVDSRELSVLSEYWLIDPNLVAYWKLDETKGTFANDYMGNKHIGRLFGDPNWRPDDGQLDGALEFDGIDDYVGVPFVLNPVDGAFSAFAWVKGGAANEAVLSQTNGAGYGRRWLCANQSDGKLMTGLADVLGGQPLQSQFIITDGNWCHIGVVWDGSRRYLYADGAEVAKDTAPLVLGLDSADGGMYLGASKTLDAANFWSGLIDDVRIYNRMLNQEEIAILAEYGD